MQRMEVPSGMLRLPLKNGVSPYVVNSTANHHSTQKHLRGNGPSNELSSKRLPRKTANLMNKTMDNLNYWKRQFNQQEPGMTAIPERLVRVGAVGRKAMITSKEESHRHAANQSSALLISQKTIPKALLKTLSPIQNSPKYLLSSYEGVTAKKNQSELASAANNQTKKGQTELDSLDEKACLNLNFSAQYLTDLRGQNSCMANDLENDPGNQHKKIEFDDDDLVFAIEI